MKRAKIMLLTIAVIATVGSALAFKVQKLGGQTFCYLETNTQPANGACINTRTSVQGVTSGAIKYFYTVKPADEACDEASELICDKSASSFIL